jgi:hypothetical protein
MLPAGTLITSSLLPFPAAARYANTVLELLYSPG